MTSASTSDQQTAVDAVCPRPLLMDPALLDQLRNELLSVTKPWWQGERTSDGGLIYGANVAGSRPPLYWCFQGYAEFAAMAEALGPDQPLYGMRSGHLVLPMDARTSAHMAVIYAEEILSLNLPPPFVLGGNCQGSRLAQKTAQMLMTLEHVVSLLILLNPPCFSPYAGRTAIIVGRYDQTNPFHRFHDADALLRANIANSTVDVLPSEHGKLFEGEILRQMSALVRQHMDDALQAYPGTFLSQTFNAEITAPAAITVKAGELVELSVTVRNTSGFVWAPTRQSGLSVGNHWRRTDGTLLQWLDRTLSLDHPLAPGESVGLSLVVCAPDREGDYLLEIDLEHAGVIWLSEMGGKPITCKVSVTSAA